jgi:hypothetical protein
LNKPQCKKKLVFARPLLSYGTSWGSQHTIAHPEKTHKQTTRKPFFSGRAIFADTNQVQPQNYVVNIIVYRRSPDFGFCIWINIC